MHTHSYTALTGTDIGRGWVGARGASVSALANNSQRLSRINLFFFYFVLFCFYIDELFIAVGVATQFASVARVTVNLRIRIRNTNRH